MSTQVSPYGGCLRICGLKGYEKVGKVKGWSEITKYEELECENMEEGV